MPDTLLSSDARVLGGGATWLTRAPVAAFRTRTNSRDGWEGLLGLGLVEDRGRRQ
jgi:hypothetical protein